MSDEVQRSETVRLLWLTLYQTCVNAIGRELLIIIVNVAKHYTATERCSSKVTTLYSKIYIL